MASYTHVRSCTSVPLPKRVCRKLRLCEVTVAAMKVEIRRIDFWRAVISECLGTLLYVLLGCCSTMACDVGYVGRGVMGGYNNDARYVLVALCFGLTAMALTQCFSHISEAHLNPVVSLTMAVTCKITPLRALLYMFAQLGGGIAGAAVLYGLAPRSCQVNMGVARLHPGMSVAQGFGLEFLITFLLVFVIFATNDPNRKETSSKVIAIGLTISTCHLAAYDFTRSTMNPARSLGPAFVMNYWSDHWIYWAGPTGGGLLAGVLYEYIFDPSRGKKRPPATPSKRASMVDDPELVSVTYPSNIHANRCVRDSYISANGVPGGIYNSGLYNGGPGTPQRRYAKTMYSPAHTLTPSPHSGLENQAYSSESYQRRSLSLIQAAAPPPPPPAPPEVGEAIMMEDVRGGNYEQRQG